jgi:hypothetical protein
MLRDMLQQQQLCMGWHWCWELLLGMEGNMGDRGMPPLQPAGRVV